MLESSAGRPEAISEPARESTAAPVGLAAVAAPPPRAKGIGGLVLTRHPGEAIVIADEIVVEVVGLNAGSVRLKITAPRSIPVHRREIYDAIRLSPRAEPPEPAGPAPGPARNQGRGSLVLTRHVHQKVVIGDDVEIEVSDLKASSVRLRINAPRDVEVHRWEVRESIRRADAVRVKDIAPES